MSDDYIANWQSLINSQAQTHQTQKIVEGRTGSLNEEVEIGLT